MAQYSRTKCMRCNDPPEKEFFWAEGMAHAWFCEKHSVKFKKEQLWYGLDGKWNRPVSQINEERNLRYGVASKKWSDGVPTKEEAIEILHKQIDNFIIKYKEGIPVGIPTKVLTTRGNYNALRYKKVPIEQLVTKSTESFSLIGSYKSGNNSAEIQSDNNTHQVIVNDQKVYESDNLGDALNRYYHELKNIAASQTEDKDLALTVFGDMVVEQNRKIIPLLNQLGKLSEVKLLEKQWAQFGVVPFNEEKDVNTIISVAIPKKEFSKKRIDREEQHPIIGGNVQRPGIADFGMRADVRKTTVDFISKGADINGAMIFVPIPEEVQQRIAVPNGEPVNRLHITLAYIIDDASKLSATQKESIIAATKESVVSQTPITINIVGAGRFTNSDVDEESFYATVSSDALLIARKRLVNILDNYNIEYSKDFDYTPHITLKYLTKGEYTPDIKLDEKFIINSFAVDFDGVITVVSFGAIDNSETIEFKSQDEINDSGTVTTKYEVKKISPYLSAAEEGESIKNNDSGVFSKQTTIPTSFSQPVLSPGWLPGHGTMGKIPVRVPIRRQGKIYYGIRWKRLGEGGLAYPRLKPQGHLIRPEDYLEDSLVHSTLYYGTDKEKAKDIFKNGFKTGTTGRFGLAFYLYTNINKARARGEVTVMAKLNTEEVFIVAHPNIDEEPIKYADFMVHLLRRNLGDPEKNIEASIDWNNEFLRRGIKALAYSLNFKEEDKEDYELEVIVFTPDVLKVIADVHKDGEKEVKTEDIQKDMGEDIPNPDYNNMPKYTYGTSGIPDATIMNKQSTFSTKDQIPAELGNNQYPIKHPIGPNLDKQKPIVEK